MTAIGLITGLYVLWKFNITHLFYMLLTTLALGASIVGLLLIVASITLHGQKRMSDKMNNAHA